MNVSKTGKNVLTVLLIVLCAVVLFVAAGLVYRSTHKALTVITTSTSEATTQPVSETELQTQTQPDNTESQSVNSEPYKLSNSELKFLSSRVVGEDYGNKYYLVLDFDYTNKSKESIAFVNNVMIKAYQNGAELKSPESSYGIQNYSSRSTEQPLISGESTSVQQAFITDDFEDEVLVEIFDGTESKTPAYKFKLIPKK